MNTILTALASISVGEGAHVFHLLSRLPSSVQASILQALDEEWLQKVGDWADAFAKEINRLPVVTASSSDVELPTFDGHYMSTMRRTVYKGTQITPQDLQAASNAITKAMKAKNFMDGIMVGLSLGQKAAMP